MFFLRRALTFGTAAMIATLTTLGIAGCAETPVSAADAYAIGCPAVDSAVATGSVANKLTTAGLEALRDSGQLSPETQAFVEATITLLEDPADAPPEVKQLIIDGCADNGQPLRNLR